MHHTYLVFTSQCWGKCPPGIYIIYVICNAQCTYSAYLVFTSVLRKVPPRNVTTRDDGAYECQISTQSKMSHFVYLKVLGKHTTHTNNSLINCTVCKIASKVRCAPHQKKKYFPTSLYYWQLNAHKLHKIPSKVIDGGAYHKSRSIVHCEYLQSLQNTEANILNISF